MRILKSTLLLAAAMTMSWTVMAKEIVLVAGATSLSGRAIVKSLLDQGYKVRAMVRDVAKAGDMGPGVQMVVADVTKPDSLKGAVKGADYVLSLIGAVPMGKDVPEVIDFKGVSALTDAAKSAGVKQFVHMTALGSGSEDPNARLNKMFNMVLMWKGKGEDYIRRSGMAWTIVRPGGLEDCDAGKTGLKIGHLDGTAQGRVCRADAGLVMIAAMGNKDYLGKTISVVKDQAGAIDGWRMEIAAIPKD
ncbi:MAG: hypothetical protein CK529_05045 [Rhodospirillaceae bacterium]|nr:MAG: hypothetical protein CK529_05045 [Rhodospirillaceae bacterium]